LFLASCTFHYVVKVSSNEWNACVVDSSGEENPFLLHEFLNSLEQSGSAVRSIGSKYNNMPVGKINWLVPIPLDNEKKE